MNTRMSTLRTAIRTLGGEWDTGRALGIYRRCGFGVTPGDALSDLEELSRIEPDLLSPEETGGVFFSPAQSFSQQQFAVVERALLVTGLKPDLVQDVVLFLKDSLGVLPPPSDAELR